MHVHDHVGNVVYSNIFSLNRTHADLTESIYRIEDELSAVMKDLEATHHLNTSIVAIMRTAEVSLFLTSWDLRPFLQ